MSLDDPAESAPSCACRERAGRREQLAQVDSLLPLLLLTSALNSPKLLPAHPLAPPSSRTGSPPALRSPTILTPLLKAQLVAFLTKKARPRPSHARSH